MLPECALLLAAMRGLPQYDSLQMFMENARRHLAGEAVLTPVIAGQ